MKLLTVQNAKTIKGQPLGYLTGILYLAPATVGGPNLCAKSTPGCRDSCLFTAGRGIFPQVMAARIRKTQWLHSDRRGFLTQLESDISALVASAKRKKLTPCVRLNGTSDLPWLAQHMTCKFPGVQFYDYTKLPGTRRRLTPNYHLTFSRSETNDRESMRELAAGTNVAVVFRVKRGGPLPRIWRGHRVIDGDKHDLRFLDPNPVVVGLREKGRARQDTTGFVVLL